MAYYQGVRSQGVEASGVERSSCDARVWVLYRRDKTRWRTLYGTVREIIQRTLAIIPWHSFAASNSEGTNYFFFSFVFCFVQFFPPRTNICIEYSSTFVTSKFRDLLRKWHHNSDDRTDIIVRLILSVLYFSLLSSCVIHHLLQHIFYASQFQGQMICFHYLSFDLLVYISILLLTPY